MGLNLLAAKFYKDQNTNISIPWKGPFNLKSKSKCQISSWTSKELDSGWRFLFWPRKGDLDVLPTSFLVFNILKCFYINRSQTSSGWFEWLKKNNLMFYKMCNVQIK